MSALLIPLLLVAVAAALDARRARRQLAAADRRVDAQRGALVDAQHRVRVRDRYIRLLRAGLATQAALTEEARRNEAHALATTGRLSAQLVGRARRTPPRAQTGVWSQQYGALGVPPEPITLDELLGERGP